MQAPDVTIILQISKTLDIFRKPQKSKRIALLMAIS
jgi:hypothetical protein